MARGTGTPPTDSVAKGGQKETMGVSTNGATPRSHSISARGVKTGEDFANLMSALMSDIIEGRISPIAANAACNAGGKLLKVVEMQYKYGRDPEKQQPRLILAGD